MLQDFSLDIAAENVASQPNPFSLEVDLGAGAALSAEELQERVFKFSFAGAALGFDASVIEKNILEGAEADLRKGVALAADIYKRRRQKELLNKISVDLKRPLNPAEREYFLAEIKKLSEPTDPATVFEEYYSLSFLYQLYNYANQKQEGFFSETVKDSPRFVKNSLETASSLVAKREYARRRAAEVFAAYENQSWFGWGIDQLKYLIPFYADVSLRGFVPEVSRLEGLLGTNLERQVVELYKKPLPEFKRSVDKILTDLTRANPSLAHMFASALLGSDSFSVVLNNALFTVVDAASLIPFGASAGRYAKKLANAKTTRDAIKDMAKESVTMPPDKAAIAEATGDIETAAVQRVVNEAKQNEGVKIKSGGPSKADPATLILSSLPSSFRATGDDVLKNRGVFSRELATRIKEEFYQTGSSLAYYINKAVKVQRVPDEIMQSEAVVKAAKDFAMQNYKGLDNTLLDVSAPMFNRATGGWYQEYFLGQPNGLLFPKAEQAYYFAKQRFEKFDIRRKGLDYYVVVTRPLPETATFVRDAIEEAVKTKQNFKSPDSWVNFLRLGFLRTPDDTMSLWQNMNRKAATYGASVLLKVAESSASKIRDLSRGIVRRDPVTDEPYGIVRRTFGSLKGSLTRENKRRWEEWNLVNEKARAVRETPDSVPGVFFKNPGEYSAFFEKHIGRLPDPIEVEAYFAYVRLYELDLAFRRLEIYKHMERNGVLNYTFSVLDSKGAKTSPAHFPAVLRNTLPNTDDTIVMFGNTVDDVKIFGSSKYMRTAEKTNIESELAAGRLKVLEIYDTEAMPLKDLSPKLKDKYVRYVIVNNFTHKPIDFTQLPKRGGGHFEYEYDFYVKQAKVVQEKVSNDEVRHWYRGDTTIMPVPIKSMGEDVAKRLDHIRVLLKENKVQEAADYAGKHFDIPWKEIRGWFYPSRTPGGEEVPARLSLTERIQVVPKGRMTVDIDNTLEREYANTFRDGTRSGSLARQMTLQYTGERDAYEVFAPKNKGTKHDPLYTLEPAKMLSPIPTIDRALARVINNVFLNDYKIFAAEQWLAEAGPYLKASKEDIRAAPFFYFRNPTFKDDAPVDIVEKLKVNHYKINQLLRVPSSLESLLHYGAQKLSDSLYTKFGVGPALYPLQMLPFVKDPFAYLRSLTFHYKLGLFNPAQVAVQLNTYVNILAVAGAKYAIPGTHATLLFLFSRFTKDPKILERIDSIATKMSLPGISKWKPGEFLEATQALERTGFSNVGHEYALRDYMQTPDIVKSRGKDFLDSGLFFFREGERNVRIGAWYTAYREFRDRKPFGALTETDTLKILNRADTLSANMSSASSSILHRGFLSVPAQFLAYQIRVAELFWGKRLGETALDRAKARARMVAWYSAMYGFPTATGLTGFPAADFIRKYALENNYVVGERALETLVHEGVPSVLIAMVAGRTTRLSEGKFYNIPERYGLQGFEFIREALRGDISWYQLLGGAAFSTLSGIYESLDPFTRALVATVRGDPGGFPVFSHDIVSAFKEITSFNQAWRTIMALNTGNWFSKKERVLENDVSAADAIFRFLTGLQSTSASDLQLMAWSEKNQAELEKKAVELFTRDFNRALRMQPYMPEAAARMFGRSFAYLEAVGMDNTKKATALAKAAKGSEALVDTVSRSFYMQSPVDVRKARQEAYEELMRRKNERIEQRGR